MIAEKRKAAIISFGVVYLIFGLILVYLVFFNAGLNVEERINGLTGAKEIAVRNDSNRLIRDVTVSFLDEFGRKKELKSIAEFFPGNEFIVDYNFPAGMPSVTIIVEAPFHQAVEKAVALHGGTGLRLSYTLEIQDFAFKGFAFPIALSVCSQGSEAKGIIVGESHDLEFFEEASGATQIEQLPAGGCKKVNFILTPKLAGKTTIYFNVSALNNTENFQKEVEVKE
ncbi:MAG: hypothetical protein V1494_01980 [Candidatus Diapherotrites archaeon]